MKGAATRDPLVDCVADVDGDEVYGEINTLCCSLVLGCIVGGTEVLNVADTDSREDGNDDGDAKNLQLC